MAAKALETVAGTARAAAVETSGEVRGVAAAPVADNATNATAPHKGDDIDKKKRVPG